MKKARGFTLIEIVIVVGIIGLLMVVLVPSITSSWNTNQMKAARLQAERIAKSIKIGVLAGDVEISTTEADLTSSSSGAINPKLNYVNYIKGIETLYENPDTNEDLKDPTSKETTEQGRIFKIINEDTGTKDADNKTIYKLAIYNAAGDLKLYQEP